MNCTSCGAAFSPQQDHQKYCSVTCKRREKWRRQEARRTALAAAAPPLPPAICAVCDEPFNPSNTSHKYCSTECQRAIVWASKRVIKTCRCGREFLTTAGRKYCSRTCRNLARIEAQRKLNAARRPVDVPDRRVTLPVVSGPQVYFVQAISGGPIKIGTSVNPQVRLGRMQSGNPERLVILHTMPGSYEEEAALRERFAAHRLHGEWFEPCEELLEIIGHPQLRIVA